MRTQSVLCDYHRVLLLQVGVFKTLLSQRGSGSSEFEGLGVQGKDLVSRGFLETFSGGRKVAII